ncbi:MAG: YdeI/OmpD-associated family protein [Edaphocola sp.]
MITFSTTLHQFEEHGDKTGWTYIEIPPDIVQQVFPGNKKSFRVKGKLDNYPLETVAVQPLGNGNFILAVNAAMRKAIGKRSGAAVTLSMERDERKLAIAPELMACLQEDAEALQYFDTLAPSHQRYFSNWVADAKTGPTQTKRIAICLSALSRQLDFGTMIREQKAKKDSLKGENGIAFPLSQQKNRR